jgi:hypothetical protein
LAQAFAQPSTSVPDPEFPSFPEIANKEDQTAGEIMAHIVVPPCQPSR